MRLIKAKAKDLQRVIAFYRDVTENSAAAAACCRWKWGQHPSQEMVSGYVQDDCMYLMQEGDRILAAAALTMRQGEDYRPVDWAVDAPDDQVAVVHLLCVDPAIHRQGMGRRMMRYLMARADAEGRKAIRLDALCCNLPAHRLYESLGFAMRGVQRRYAENMGEMDFWLYEYPLRQEPLTFRTMSPQAPDAMELIQALNRHLCGLLGDDGSRHVHYDGLEPPQGIFMVGYCHEVPVCCAGIQPLQDRCGEIKRVYARRNHAGFGTQLFAALEKWAAEHGRTMLKLECREANAHAIGFYYRRGYTRCENYPPYVGQQDAVCMEKRLLPPDGSMD